MRFSIEEQETVITYDAKNKEWAFYTCVPSQIKTFLENPSVKGNFEILTEDQGQPTSIRFKLEKSLVKKQFIKSKRTLSNDHLQALKRGRESLC